jgi:DNA replication and repair protein RecF
MSFLESIRIENFRNLGSQSIDFNSRINCIFGDNGNGKTNLLESIYFLLNRKSFKKNIQFKNLLSIDSSESEIRLWGVYSIDSERMSITARIKDEDEEWWVNGERKARDKHFTVAINPFDPSNFTSSFSHRRDWFETILSQLDEDFKKKLGLFRKIYKQRNFLLKNKPYDYKSQLNFFDSEYAKVSSDLSRKKNELIGQMNPILKNVFHEIFFEENLIQLEIQAPSHHFSPELLFKKLLENREKEEILGTTLSGSHKDDYVIKFDGYNAFEFCSLGQLKMAYLSILFAYINVFRYKFGVFPIVFIDDVSGELDRHRWKRLVNYLDSCNFQVFISTANEKFREELSALSSAKYITLVNGEII